ncbi:PAS domain S-box protein [Planctomycetota bacterium]
MCESKKDSKGLIREEWRQTFDAVPDLIAILDSQCHIVRVNKAMTERLSLSQEECEGQICYKVLHGTDEPPIFCPHLQLMNDGKEHTAELNIERLKGDFIVSVSPLFDEEGKLIGCVHVARDITEHKKAEEALKESEKRYRALFQGSAEGIVAADIETKKFRYANPAICRMLRYTEEELTQMGVQDIHPKEDLERILCEFEAQACGDKALALNIPCLCKDGTIIYADINTAKIVIDGRECNVGFFTDITARRWAQEEIERLAKFPAEDPNPVLRVSKDCTILYANSASSVVLETWDRQVGQRLPELCCKRIKEVLSSGKVSIFEFPCHDGRIFEVTLAPMVESGYVNAYGLDITEHKRAEQVIHDSEEKYRRLVENLRQEYFFYSHRPDGVFEYISPSITQVLGYSEQEFLKHYTEYLTDNPINKEVIHHSELSVQGKQQPPYEVEIFHKDGSIHRLEVAEAPVFDEQGKVIAVEGIAHDITERLRAEVELQKARDELEIRVEQRTADLGAVVKELKSQIAERKRAEEKLIVYQKELRSLASELFLAEERLRRRIASNVHDNIGQSLAMSKMKLESLSESISSPELVRTLEEVRNLLAAAIVNSRSLTSQLSPPVLYELGFEAALEWLVKDARQEYGFSAEFEDDGRSKPLSDDVRVLLFQAVRELLVNVAKHAQAQSVRVCVQRSGEGIQVNVEDDGTGFDILEHDSVGTKTSGFGLFSIRERLGHIGGHCEVESKPGSGTCVRLRVPVDGNSQKDREPEK